MCAVKGQVLVTHRANWSLVLKQPHEIGTDVGGPVLVPIQRKHAVSLCATPQSTNSFLLLAHFNLLLLPRSARTQAAAAGLRAVSLGCALRVR